MSCATFERAAAYLAGELALGDEQSFEDHLFGCDACTTLLEETQAVVAGIARVTPAVVSRARVERLRGAGARIRETEVAAGATVDVTFDTDLDILLHVLRGELHDAERIDVELHDAGGMRLLHVEQAAPFDAAAGTVHIACQRHFAALGYPDDICFRVVAVAGDARRVIGDYVVRHHYVE
jgi:putative zinc finger protein